MAELPKLIDGALSAWEEDFTIRFPIDAFQRPILQAQIIPLACVWGLANATLGHRPRSVYQFTQDVLNKPTLAEVWRANALKVGDPDADIKEIPYSRYIENLEHVETGSPYEFERFAAKDGQPDGRSTITGLEVSLISTLGHAAYNSTSGTPYLALSPLGPYRLGPKLFLEQAGERVTDFTHKNL